MSDPSEKMCFDERDFESLSWHDNRVHGIAFSPEAYELSLDIDHITKWFTPGPGENLFNFLLAPATMCFRNASNIDTNFKIESIYDLSISELRRTFLRRSPNDLFDVHKYEVEFHYVGAISLEATGFLLSLRRKPIRTGSQFFEREERGGVSFAQ